MRAFPVIPINPVSGLVGGAVSASTETILNALSSWIASGAAKALGSLTAALDAETSPNLGAQWFLGQYRTMLAVATLLALPLLCGAVITSVVRQDPGPLVRAVLVQLPLATVGTGVAINVTTLALAGTDELCAMVSKNTGADTHVLFQQLAHILDGGMPGAGGFGVLLVSVLIAFGAFVLTLELIVRSAATYVAMLFLPVALIGLIWPVTARWGRRVAEMLTALILSKFVVVAVLSLAIAALRGGLAREGMSGLLTGAALLLLACMSPFALLRMVPIIEAGAIAHLDGAGRRAAQAPVNGPVQAHHTYTDAKNTANEILKSVDRDSPPGGEPGQIGGGPSLDTQAGGSQSTIKGVEPKFADGGGGGGSSGGVGGGGSAVGGGGGGGLGGVGGGGSAVGGGGGGLGGVGGGGSAVGGGVAGGGGGIAVAGSEAAGATAVGVAAAPAVIAEAGIAGARAVGNRVESAAVAFSELEP